jgi:hypothetical protein
LSLTACVLLVALWVRSYWWCDLVSRLDANNANSQAMTFASNRGTVYFVRIPLPGGRAAGPRAISPHGWRHSSHETSPVDKSFNWQFSKGITHITLPLWLIVPILAAVGATPWIKRFSLRTLLIATTLVAVGLGIVVLSS